MKTINASTELIQTLLDQEDFASLENELQGTEKYLPVSLKVKAWSELADFYASKGLYVSSIVALNLARVGSLKDIGLANKFVERLREFWAKVGIEATKGDISKLLELMERLSNYYRVQRIKEKGIQVSLSSLSSALISAIRAAQNDEAGPATAEVSELCNRLEDDMTIEEVRVEMAKLLVPELEKIIGGMGEREKAVSKSEGRKVPKKGRRK